MHRTPLAKGDQFDFNWTKPGFPGTIIAGRFVDPVSVQARGNVKVYLTVAHQASAQPARPDRHQANSTSSPTASASRSPRHLNVVEMPDDTLPAVWAPELAAIMGSRVGDKSAASACSPTPSPTSGGAPRSAPRTLNDAWITNGMSRYGELMYVEDDSGKSALNAAPAGRLRRRARLRHHSAVQLPAASLPSRRSSSP